MPARNVTVQQTFPGFGDPSQDTAVNRSNSTEWPGLVTSDPYCYIFG